MRSLRLAKVVAQAEVLRLREMARRQARRAAVAAVGLFFLIAFLIAGHIAVALVLVPWVTPLQAVLIVGAGDLFIGLVLMLVASRSKPGPIEAEAAEMGLRVRDELRQALTVPSMLGGAARTVGIDTLIRFGWSLISGKAFRRGKA
jgi:hypothetical protein